MYCTATVCYSHAHCTCLQVLGCNFNGILLVDLHYLTKNGYASVGATLVSKGLAVRGHKKQTEEGIPRHCTLGCGDTRQVTVPVAENPFDFFVHIVSDSWFRDSCACVCIHVNNLDLDFFQRPRAFRVVWVNNIHIIVYKLLHTFNKWMSTKKPLLNSTKCVLRMPFHS